METGKRPRTLTDVFAWRPIHLHGAAFALALAPFLVVSVFVQMGGLEDLPSAPALVIAAIFKVIKPISLGLACITFLLASFKSAIPAATAGLAAIGLSLYGITDAALVGLVAMVVGTVFFVAAKP